MARTVHYSILFIVLLFVQNLERRLDVFFFAFAESAFTD